MRVGLAVLVLQLSGAASFAQQEPPASPAPAANPDIIVRERLAPASGAVIGQHVALYVDVLFRDQMPRPPRVAMPEVPGLQIIRFETQATTMQDRVGDASYVGQRFEFAIYPRRGGSFSLPPAAVTLLDRDGAVSGSVQGQGVPLEVTVPPGVDPSLPVIATNQLTLNEQWSSPPTDAFKAGDALVRTITRSAEDIPGLAMRELGASTPEGVRVYAEPPDISDSSNRGVVTGHRTDRLTYVFQRAGRFDLPSLDQPWWDLQAGRLEHAVAQGVTVGVDGTTPAAAAHEPTGAGASRIAIGAALLAVLGLAIALLARRRHARAPDPEQTAFAALQHAGRHLDVAATYRCFSAWTRLLPAGRREQAAGKAVPLRAALFAGAKWTREDASTLLDTLAELRRAPSTAGRRTVLPPLNPSEPVGTSRGGRRIDADPQPSAHA